jgi:hypothetical protein
MNCPLCSREMDKGEAYVRGTALGFLFVGLSHQHCWFKSEATGKKDIIVRCPSGLLTSAPAKLVNPSAYRCENCRTSVIVGPDS